GPAALWTAERMKRIGTWALYLVGTVAILYLALYAYAVLTQREFTPGDPIHIFRNPEAPNYS
ncbi:MAG: hypothetical protein E6833_13890, partial [Bradyrhizobium sp.]|nr:hypothetical protein [Bradyrhizobium sp.]